MYCVYIMYKYFKIKLIIFVLICNHFPWASQMAQWLRICLQCRRCESDPWVEEIPWSRNGNPPQYSCLENSMDRGPWWTISSEVAKSWLDTVKLMYPLSMHSCSHFLWEKRQLDSGWELKSLQELLSNGREGQTRTWSKHKVRAEGLSDKAGEKQAAASFKSTCGFAMEGDKGPL